MRVILHALIVQLFLMRQHSTGSYGEQLLQKVPACLTPAFSCVWIGFTKEQIHTLNTTWINTTSPYLAHAASSAFACDGLRSVGRWSPL